jgi:hypothetical protein
VLHCPSCPELVELQRHRLAHLVVSELQLHAESWVQMGLLPFPESQKVFISYLTFKQFFQLIFRLLARKLAPTHNHLHKTTCQLLLEALISQLLAVLQAWLFCG